MKKTLMALGFLTSQSAFAAPVIHSDRITGPESKPFGIDQGPNRNATNPDIDKRLPGYLTNQVRARHILTAEADVDDGSDDSMDDSGLFDDDSETQEVGDVDNDEPDSLDIDTDEPLEIEDTEMLDIDDEDDELMTDPEEEIELESPTRLAEEEAIDAESEGREGFSVGGKVAAEYRYYSSKGTDPGQDYHYNGSFSLEPKFSYIWDGEDQSLDFVPFYRYDQHDSQRSHFDIREFMWSVNADDWVFRAGIGRVFWGVTESRHTVNIINQSDLVENLDTEDKLGQPMVNLSYTTENAGTFDFFYLPVSRKATFPGRSGRVRPEIFIDEDAAIFNGSASSTHQDFAVRWAHTIGILDVGVSHFRGTTREPRFVAADFNPATGLPDRLRPVYEVINQTGFDLSAVTGNWLWKLELYTRGGQGQRFEEVTGGFEYTFDGVFESGADLGFLFEYLYNGRPDDQLTTSLDDDIFIGTRFALNDVQNTQILAGIIKDLNHDTWAYNVEASRRLGENWRVYLEIRGLSHAERDDLTAFSFRKEDYIMLELEFFL